MQRYDRGPRGLLLKPMVEHGVNGLWLIKGQDEHPWWHQMGCLPQGTLPTYPPTYPPNHIYLRGPYLPNHIARGALAIHLLSYLGGRYLPTHPYIWWSPTNPHTILPMTMWCWKRVSDLFISLSMWLKILSLFADFTGCINKAMDFLTV